MKLVISGGRDFDNRDLMIITINSYLLGTGPFFEVVHGGCRGADLLCDEVCKEVFNIHPTVFPYLSEYGKAGGPMRNAQMAEYGDELLAFWDGTSRGTRDMINQMRKLRKPIKVVYY